MRPLLALSLLASPALAQEPPTWAEIGPLLASRCLLCHIGEEAPRGLHLDTYEGALAGSRNGPVLVAGDPAGSELVRRVRGLSQPSMPLVGAPLAENEIAMIEAWIAAGMPEGSGATTDPVVEVAPDEEEPAPEAPVAEPPADEPVAGSPAGPPAEEAPTPVAAVASALPGPGEPVTFAHVERIFLQRCVHCHSDANPEGPPEEVRLDTLAHILEGGERLVLVPGNVAASEIIRRVEGRAEPRMPFDGPPWLSDEDIDLLRRWIEGGAPDAEGAPSPVPVGAEVRYRGIMTGEAEIDGIPFRVGNGTRIDDRPGVGQEGEVRGVVAPDGGIEATRLRDR